MRNFFKAVLQFTFDFLYWLVCCVTLYVGLFVIGYFTGEESNNQYYLEFLLYSSLIGGTVAYLLIVQDSLRKDINELDEAIGDLLNAVVRIQNHLSNEDSDSRDKLTQDSDELAQDSKEQTSAPLK